MPIRKIEITNPEALKLINDIKSGAIFIPLKAWVIKNKWYIISVSAAFILIIALVIGKKLSEGNPVQVFSPPDIESVTPIESAVVTSDFSGLRKEILDLNTDLPDPFIPEFDNDINLETTAI